MGDGVILGVSKVKRIGKMIARGEERWGEGERGKGDGEKRGKNKEWGEVKKGEWVNGGIDEGMRVVTKKKERKWGVVGVEYVIRGRKEGFWEDGGKRERSDYLSDGVRWVEDKEGKEKVVGVNMEDEEVRGDMVGYVVGVVIREGKKGKG